MFVISAHLSSELLPVICPWLVSCPDHGRLNGSTMIRWSMLTGSFDHTLESLRGLVGRVRVGGEQIGSAASQVLVAAREQAAVGVGAVVCGVGDDGDD